MNRTADRRTALLAAAGTGVGALIGAAPATAQDVTRLRLQTHISENSIEGRGYSAFAERCSRFSGGRLEIEMHFSSDIVKDFEAFDAVRNGIIDGDCTSPTFITGKEPAFQFFGDLLGGYSDPSQFLAWLRYGGGREVADELYHGFGTHLVSLYFAGPEALSSTRPLPGVADLNGWKMRCPPGMETEIFTRLGAKPVVMPFAEVFTALSTGVVDGCDAAQLSVNKQLGLYEVAKHATYPGFHSMAANHLNINLRKWEALPDDLKQVMAVAFDGAMQTARLEVLAADAKVASELKKVGVTLHKWSGADLGTYNQAAYEMWMEWAGRSPLAKQAVDTHVTFMRGVGILA